MSMHSNDQHDSEHEHTHGGLGLYTAVFACLVVLTALSFWVGSTLVNTSPALGKTLMILISCGKALLVMLFFMHLKWEANWKYVLTIPAGIMAVFLTLMLIPDIGRRGKNYSEERLRSSAEPEKLVEHRAEDHTPTGSGDQARDHRHGDEPKPPKKSHH